MDTEILSVLLMLETSAFTLSVDIVAARRFLAVAVVKISRAPAVEARARRQLGRAAGGSLMTISAASLPLGVVDR